MSGWCSRVKIQEVQVSVCGSTNTGFPYNPKGYFHSNPHKVIWESAKSLRFHSRLCLLKLITSCIFSKRHNKRQHRNKTKRAWARWVSTQTYFGKASDSTWLPPSRDRTCVSLPLRRDGERNERDFGGMWFIDEAVSLTSGRDVSSGEEVHHTGPGWYPLIHLCGHHRGTESQNRRSHGQNQFPPCRESLLICVKNVEDQSRCEVWSGGHWTSWKREDDILQGHERLPGKTWSKSHSCELW